jgi:RimJ/RimL family protein N-acetyltransferase
MNTLKTNRLTLRQLTTDDAESFYLLNNDPEVLQFTGDKPFADVAAARVFLEGYDQYQKYGVGRWAVIRKEDSVFLGWCGLKYTPETNEYDIGFRFFKCFWNQGYATEAAKACLDYGFTVLGLNVIIGRAMKENIASIKVLRKIGMTFDKELDFNGSQGMVYITRCR